MAQVDDYDAALGARTQSLYRQVNEGIRQINAAFGHLVPLGDWACECADQSCSDRISLTTEEYERVRAVPTHFAVAPGSDHVFEAIEDVIERHTGYWVVEKNGTAAELVTKVDPRAAPSSG